MGVNFISEPAREIPVAAESDVIVAGGGPSGLVAAVAAARAGAKTLLVERYGFLGGMATAGLITAFARFSNGRGLVIEGIPLEIVRRLDDMGGLRKGDDPEVHHWLFFDPEVLKHLAIQMVEEAGVELLLHSYISASYVEDGQIKGIVVENKSGRQALLGKVVVDATGDGDVAARAGVPFEKGRAEDGLMNPMSLFLWMENVDHEQVQRYHEVDPRDYAHKFPRTWARAMEAGEVSAPIGGLMSCDQTPRPGSYQVHVTRVLEWLDATDAQQLTRAQVKAFKQAMEGVAFLQKHIPGFEHAYLSQTAPNIGVRETRRIQGEYILTAEDVLTARKFEDAIARGCYPVDVHNPKGAGIMFRHVPEGESYDIPYRCLVPREIDGLLTAGRCISTTHEAHGSIRVMSHCMAIGHAAGVAAGVAARKRLQPRDLDAGDVRRVLLDQGANLG
jgi:ribulose 1,5-bisphosphate synthetase/thiazole synthase